MRSIVVALVMSGAGLSSPAWAQDWSGSLPAVQNQERTLTFEVSNLEDLIAWNFYLAFSPSAFATPTISTPITLGMSDIFAVGPAGAPVELAGLIPPGYQEILVDAGHALPISVSGSLLSVQFNALPGALGSTQVFSRFYYVLDGAGGVVEQTIDLPPLSTTIAAIPEPHTWALMLCGVGAVFGWVARRRSAAA